MYGLRRHVYQRQLRQRRAVGMKQMLGNVVLTVTPLTFISFQ